MYRVGVLHRNLVLVSSVHAEKTPYSAPGDEDCACVRVCLLRVSLGGQMGMRGGRFLLCIDVYFAVYFWVYAM